MGGCIYCRKRQNKIIDLYRIYDGEKRQVKIRNKIYEKNPFYVGNILEIRTFDREGKWIKDNETKEWMKSTTEFEDF